MWTPPPQPTTPQQRRQKIGLIVFVILFFLFTINDDETKSNEHSPTPFFATSPLQQRLKTQLEQSNDRYPQNLTGYFSGTWAFGSNSIPSSFQEDVGVVIGVPTYLRPPPATPTTYEASQHIFHGFTQNQGTFLFRITKSIHSTKSAAVVEVQGSLRFIDGYDVDDWTLNSWSAISHGLYFPGNGRLTMFTNSWNYNLYLRTNHDPGTSGTIHHQNDTLYVVADSIVGPPQERKGEEGDDNTDATNHTLPTGNTDKHDATLPCITRVDMNVSLHTIPPASTTRAAASTAIAATRLSSSAHIVLSRNEVSTTSHADNTLSYLGTITTPLNCPLRNNNNNNINNNNNDNASSTYLTVHANGPHVNFENMYSVGRWYGMFACLVSIVQLASHVQLLKAAQNPLVAQSVSPISFLMIALFDAADCALHSVIALLFDGLFSWFVLVALLKFILVS